MRSIHIQEHVENLKTRTVDLIMTDFLSKIILAKPLPQRPDLTEKIQIVAWREGTLTKKKNTLMTICTLQRII